MASSKRPPLITSSVAPIFARSAGDLNELQRTLALTRTRRVSVAHAVIVVHDSRMSPARIGDREQVIDEVDGVEAEVVADPRGLRDAIPAVVGLAQERAEADGTGREARHSPRLTRIR